MVTFADIEELDWKETEAYGRRGKKADATEICLGPAEEDWQVEITWFKEITVVLYEASIEEVWEDKDYPTPFTGLYHHWSMKVNILEFKNNPARFLKLVSDYIDSIHARV